MKAFGFLTSFLVILSMLVELAMCDNQTYSWNVSLVNWSVDGVESEVIAINGQFPGPTIRAMVGDMMVINVTNLLPEEAISIHWHGIRQIGTPWADGTAFISQCPTQRGETFSYQFTVDKAGTYFYHGHYNMERVQGLYGMLIVEDAKNATGGRDLEYDDELEILLSDWWHKSSTQQEDELSSNPMVWVGEPQSLLINGRGQYNCFMAPGLLYSKASKQCVFDGSEQNAPTILQVSPHKTYRIRLVSATSLASLNFAIQNHTLQVVEVDGNLVEPFEAQNVYIFPGQSLSVLIKTDLPADRYWVSASVVARKPNTTQGLTVLSYDTNKTMPLPTTTPTLHLPWNDTGSMKNFSRQILAKKGSPAPPPTGHKYARLYLLNTQNFFNGLTKWAINNVSLVLPQTPYLAAFRYNLTDPYNTSSPPRSFSRNYDITKPAANKNTTVGDMLYKFELGTIVDVILQNANAIANDTSETHPWHLHGHDFWVLGFGHGNFMKDTAKFNLENAPLKSTEVVYPYGWTALRFKADNPGVWAFHCHIEPHMHMGMGVVFAEGTDQLTKVPTEGLQCGKVPKI